MATLDTSSVESWTINGTAHHVGMRNMYVNANGNLVLETTTAAGNTTNGNINIEAMKNIQIKPGTVDGGSGDVRLYSDHTGSDTQVVMKFLSGSDTAKAAVASATGTSDDKVIRFKAITAEMEFNNKGTFSDSDFNDDTFQTKYKNDDTWIDEISKSKAHDIRCMGNGGIAIQPSGCDKDGHINKIKFEHSLKVPIEHFAEYTIGSSVTTYNFSADSWHVLGQLASANGACQILGNKILNKTLASWNDDMTQLSDDTSVGFVYGGLEYAVGYSSSSSASNVTMGSVSGTAASGLDGKYICVKRLAVSGYAESSLSAVYVSLTSDTNKYVSAASGITLASAASSSSTSSATKLTRNSDSKEFVIDASGSVLIDDILTYTVSTSAGKVSMTGSTSTYTISSSKFSITPLRGVHFNDEGGKGLEFGTFNPLHASLYCADYRFRGASKIYGVTRSDLTQSSSDKMDYETCDDDFKDIIDEDNSCTWNDIIAAVKFLKSNGSI